MALKDLISDRSEHGNPSDSIKVENGGKYQVHQAMSAVFPKVSAREGWVWITHLFTFIE